MLSVAPILAVVVVLALFGGFALVAARPKQARSSEQFIGSGSDRVQVTGEVVRLNRVDHFHHPVGARVIAASGRRVLGSGTVDPENTFALSIPAEFRGEVELRIDRHGAAPSLIEAEGNDMADVVVFYNPVNNFLA